MWPLTKEGTDKSLLAKRQKVEATSLSPQLEEAKAFLQTASAEVVSKTIVDPKGCYARFCKFENERQSDRASEGDREGR